MTLRQSFTCDVCGACSVVDSDDGSDGIPPGWYAVGVTRPVAETDGADAHYRRDADACSLSCYRTAMGRLMVDPSGETIANTNETPRPAATTKGN